eukprot:6200100-Pleurochrysis_carterae.AAC.3
MGQQHCVHDSSCHGGGHHDHVGHEPHERPRVAMIFDVPGWRGRGGNSKVHGIGLRGWGFVAC